MQKSEYLKLFESGFEAGIESAWELEQDRFRRLREAADEPDADAVDLSDLIRELADEVLGPKP